MGTKIVLNGKQPSTCCFCTERSVPKVFYLVNSSMVSAVTSITAKVSGT